METMLVRLKPLDPRRGHVLRRYPYQGIKFHEERGWYRVAKAVADYLRSVHQQPADPHSPLAFDVCTEEEARAAEAKEKEAQNARKTAAVDIKLSVARPAGAVTTADLPEAPKDDKKPRKDRA